MGAETPSAGLGFLLAEACSELKYSSLLHPYLHLQIKDSSAVTLLFPV